MPTPVTTGSEFQVNTYTSSDQRAPSITALAGGGFVVTWESFGQDSSSLGVFGQRYSAGGVAVGSEFQISTYTFANQYAPSVTGLSGGGFVATWGSWQDGSFYGIYGQRYDANGVAAGSEFQVNTYTTDSQDQPSVAALLDGGYVVTWESNAQDGSNRGIYGQRYDASGVAAGSEFQVNTFSTNNQFAPSITGLSGGGFVTTWVSDGQDGIGYSVFGQRYDASGVASGSEFQVNTFSNTIQDAPSVTALSDGGFVVTWNSNLQDGSGHGVFGQRYDASGTAAGSEFQINTYITSTQDAPSVTALSDGGFVVAWHSNLQDGSGYGIFGQRYDASGTAAGSEFQINTYTTTSQLYASVTALEGGGFVVTWQSDGQDGSANGVFGQMFSYADTTFTAGNDIATLYGPGQTVDGLAGDDVINGADYTDGADTIRGGAGNDTLFGLAGSDTLEGGADNDTLDGGAGNDALDGGTGSDTASYANDTSNVTVNLTTGTASSTGSGNDTLANIENITTGSGNDSLTGDAGNNVLDGRAGNDALDGGAGSDRVSYASDTSNVTVNLTTGTASSTGSGSDTLTNIENVTTGSGDDNITGDAGNNVLDGGAGTDTASYAADTGTVTVNLAAGTASSTASGSDTLTNIENVTTGSGNDNINGSAGANNIQSGAGDDVVVAGAGNDTVNGGAGFDWLYGGAGDDTIYAGDGATDVSLGDAGNDTIYGQNGFDYMYGYADNDSLWGGNGVDVAYGGDGNDNLYGEADTDWLYGGNGADNLFGGANPDLLFGEAGADRIDGGADNDWIWGGGSDGLGDGAADIFLFDNNSGVDVIYDFENGIDKIDLSGASASSFAEVTVGQIAGGFTWIAYDSNVLYLWGAGNQVVGAGNIDASDFIFV